MSAIGAQTTDARGSLPTTADASTHTHATLGRSSRPTVTVVVAMTNVRYLAEPGFTSVIAGCAQVAAEVVVAHSDVIRRISQLNSRYPGIRFVSAGTAAGHPELRSLGMRHAGGDVVIVLEDTSLSNADAIEAIIRGFSMAARQTGSSVA